MCDPVLAPGSRFFIPVEGNAGTTGILLFDMQRCWGECDVKRLQPLLCVVCFCLTFFLLPQLAAAQPLVLVVPIKGEITNSQAVLVHRAMITATQQGAIALMLEIDTQGGQVAPALQIRDMLTDAALPTAAYIRNRAWSAGALIALANTHLAMAPGSSIGAAEPIPNTEKNIAALKAEFAATASRTGREPRLAEAMVDKSLGYPGIALPGQIVALTDRQALQTGYAEVIAPDRGAVLAAFGWQGARVEDYSQSWPEKISSFIAQPVAMTLLIALIFLAALVEMKTAGLGAAAVVGLGATALLFANQWLAGVSAWWTVALFFLGLLLLFLELHSGGFIAGLSGVSAILTSLFLTLGGGSRGAAILAAGVVVAVIAFMAIMRFLPTSPLWHKLVLHEVEDKQGGFSSAPDFSHYLGREGVALTLLRPAGTALVDGRPVDVVSEGAFIAAGTRIVVVAVTGSRVVVRPRSV